MTQKTINIALNTGYLSGARECMHNVWQGATVFSYLPPNIAPEHLSKYGYPQFRIGDQKADIEFLRMARHIGPPRDIVAAAQTNAIIFDHGGSEIFADPDGRLSLEDQTLVQIGYVGKSNPLFLAYLDDRGLLREKKESYRHFIREIGAVSAVVEGDGLTLFLEMPPRYRLTGPAFDEMGGRLGTHNKEEAVYVFPSGQKIVMITKKANRDFQRQHPDIVRKNQLFYLTVTPRLESAVYSF